MILTLEQARHAIAHGTGNGILIAVLDTGIDQGHPHFSKTNFNPPWQVTAAEKTLVVEKTTGNDPGGHGTSVASIIHTLAPEATLVSIRVLGSSLRQQRHEVIRQGALKAMSLGARILNCSFGVPGSSYTLPIYKSWIDEGFLRDHQLVTASSNIDTGNPEWPAHFLTTHSVTNIDCDPLSIYYRQENTITFGAKGDDVRVATSGGGYSTLTGSSFATAHVSALLARLLSKFPMTSPSQARDLLRHLYP